MLRVRLGSFVSSGDASLPAGFTVEPDRVHLLLNSTAYALSAIQKTGYRLARRCTLLIGESKVDGQHVSLLLPVPLAESEARAVALDFLRELTDQQLREHIREETKGIRELILAHAFSKTDLVGRQ